MSDHDLETAIRDVFTRQAAAIETPVIAVPVVDDNEPSPALGDQATTAEALPFSPTEFPNGNGSRRSNTVAVVAAIAASIMAVLGAAALLVVLRPDGNAVVTDLPSTTRPTIPPTTAPTDPDEPAEFELAAGPRLLPPDDTWVIVGYQQRGGDGPGEVVLDESEIYVFEKNGKTYLLTVNERSGGLPEFVDGPDETAFNRVTRYGNLGEIRLGFTGFDVGGAEFAAAADSLEQRDGTWMLPDATEVLFEDRPAASTQSVQIEIAPVGEDGRPDLSSTVTQLTSARSLGSLYQELGEASSIGTTEPFDIAGGVGFLITGSVPEYALHYRDGYVSSWQSMGEAGQIERLVSSLSVATRDDWALAVERAVDVRRETIAAAAETLGPIEAVDLPRFVLPDPWELESVFDESQWTPEERAQWQAAIAAQSGGAPYRIAWSQTFRRAANAGNLIPDVIVQVWDEVDQNRLIAPEQQIQPFSIGGFEGNVTIGDADKPHIIVSRGATTIDIGSVTLSQDELIAFADGLALRSADGTTGFDLTSDDFTLGVDISSPYDGPDSGAVWSTSWRNDGSEISLSLQEAPPGVVELTLGFEAAFTGSVFELVPGESMYLLEQRGLTRIVIDRPDLGAHLWLIGGHEHALDAAKALVQVSEDEWTAAVAPFIKPPNPNGGN